MRASVALAAAAAAALAGAAWGLRGRLLPADEPGRAGDWLDEVQAVTAPDPLPVLDARDARAYRSNVAAFLAVIRAAEGTSDADGYRALFGHRPDRPRLFESFADHPRIAQRFTDRAGRQLWTTAAGAYQFLAVSAIPGGGLTRVDTWDRLQRRLALPDFSPASQDAAAVELIREAGALPLVEAGDFDAAIAQVRGIWASLPGAGYAQPERSLAFLRNVFTMNGGSFA